MSLIVDALRRAQDGASRRLPPLAGARSPLPGLAMSRRRSGRARTIGLLAAAVVVVAGAWLGRGYLLPTRTAARAPAPLAPPLLVVDAVPLPAAVPTPPPAADAPVPEAETPAVAARPRGRRAPAPPPVVPPLLPSAAAAPSRPAVAPAPVVEIRVDRTKLAEDSMAAGIVSQRRGDLADAIEQYRQGIAVDPRNAGLHNNLGIALRQSGRLDEAVQSFEMALQIDAKYEKALNNLGVSRYQQGQYAAAIDLFKQAIRVNPANAESHVNLGVIYLPAGRFDDALSEFQEALRYDPRSAEANYNLALLWERRGDQDRARPYYERFVELAGSQHADLAARVKERLQQFDRRR